MALLKDLIVLGPSRFIEDIYGKKFITNGGTSSQFVKGDGTLDSNTYLKSSDISTWAKASTKPSYTLDEVSDGTTRKLSDKAEVKTYNLNSSFFEQGYTYNMGTEDDFTLYPIDEEFITNIINDIDAGNIVQLIDYHEPFCIYHYDNNDLGYVFKRTHIGGSNNLVFDNEYIFFPKSIRDFLAEGDENFPANDIPEGFVIYTSLSSFNPNNGALTGIPTAPTAVTGTNTTQIATTAFVQTALSGQVHGNITNAGALQTTDITIASGDKLVVTDASDSNKVARTSVSFDGSTDTKALTQKGTWENFLKTQAYLGTCSTSANTYVKEATVDTFPLDSNNKPLIGTTVGIKFSNSNTYATSGNTYQLNVNTTGNYPMYYNNAELATSTSANTLVAGYKNRYVFYVFNGTQWVFLFASYDTNTTYSAMTQAEIDAGTSTTGRTMTPARLRSNFYTEGEVDTLLAGKANIGMVQTVTAAATISPNISSGNVVVVSGSTNIGAVTPTMENGQEITIFFTASMSYNVTFGSSAYVTPDGSDLIISVPTSGYCEASIVKAEGNLYVRAI